MKSLLNSLKGKIEDSMCGTTHSGYGITHSGYGTTLVGCRGGNRYVEGDLLTFGCLMLDDALGYPYYRLFNVRPTTSNQQPTTNNQQPTTNNHIAT